MPITGDSFQRRVELLRDSWAERRQLKGLASSHDLESQLRLLATLHGWAEEAVRDIRSVYGPGLALSLSPPPEATSGSPAFTVTVGNHYTATFMLTERRRLSGAGWFVTVTVGSGGPGGSVAAAGPERRNGQWTRSRFEEILLSVLGAHERSLSEDGLAGFRRGA